MLQILNGRLLREYINGLVYWLNRMGISLEEVHQLMKKYEEIEYGERTDILDGMKEQLLKYNKKIDDYER